MQYSLIREDGLICELDNCVICDANILICISTHKQSYSCLVNQKHYHSVNKHLCTIFYTRLTIHSISAPVGYPSSNSSLFQRQRDSASASTYSISITYSSDFMLTPRLRLEKRRRPKITFADLDSAIHTFYPMNRPTVTRRIKQICIMTPIALNFTCPAYSYTCHHLPQMMESSCAHFLYYQMY